MQALILSAPRPLSFQKNLVRLAYPNRPVM
jgi:hypothetical protein